MAGFLCSTLAALFGSSSRARTCDPVINSHLLYQLSYRGMALARERILLSGVRPVNVWCPGGVLVTLVVREDDRV